MDTKVTRVPNYGIKLKLNHRYTEQWSQIPKLKFSQILPLIGMLLRYIFYFIKCWFNGRKVPINYFYNPPAQQIYGCPLGGIGAGTIGRGFKGEFCRFQLTPGVYEYNTVDANQFIVTIKDTLQKTIFQSVISTSKKKNKKLSSWQRLLDGSKCKYTALYPRSWTEYDLTKYGIKLTCRQISPVIPHNYKDSSIPCAVFVWDVENVSPHGRIVTISFTFKNGTKNKTHNEGFPILSKDVTNGETECIELHHRIKGTPCTYVLGAKKSEWLAVSKCLCFDPNSDGYKPWKELYERGKFKKSSEKEASSDNGEMACSLACKVKLMSIKSKTVEMCLVWDMPSVKFPGNGPLYHRFYSKYFKKKDCSSAIAEYALETYKYWETIIYNWQEPILNDYKLPDWYKSALFNELYFIADGGTIWFLTEDDCNIGSEDPRRKFGRIAFLQGHQCRFYNSVAAQFHASFALAMNWPNLQLCIQYDMADAIGQEIAVSRYSLRGGLKYKRKVPFTVPHDFGDPYEEPFSLLNAYPNSDVSKWRDLNVKFVLQVLRDFKLFKKYEDVNRIGYLNYVYRACEVVMVRTSIFDKDGDGLIENSGHSDQTYDTWLMTGPSAYCNNLWIAALYAMATICDVLDLPEKQNNYISSLQKAENSYEEKLWNGEYYKFDTSEKSDTIMADQLCGHWYLRCSRVISNVFPQDHVLKTLKTIYDNNIKAFGYGYLGAVNGYFPNGHVDITSIHSEEVWTGVTYSLASLMIHEGFINRAWKTAGGMYELLSKQLGFNFQTPEAFKSNGCYRYAGSSSGLCIWSMQLALEQRKEQQDN